jgi:hypothetical protein
LRTVVGVRAGLTYREPSLIALWCCGLALGVVAVVTIVLTGPLGVVTLAASLTPVVLACGFALVVGRYLRIKLRTTIAWTAVGAAAAAPIAGVFSLATLPLGLSSLAGAVIVAPVVEELAKIGVARRFVGARSRVALIASAACVAGGFAAIEDVLYLAGSEGEYVTTLVARCVISPLVHVAFTVVAVLGWHRGGARRWACVVGGVLLHASWNLTMSSATPGGTLLLLAAAFSAIPVVVCASMWEWQRDTLRRGSVVIHDPLYRKLVTTFNESSVLYAVPPRMRGSAIAVSELRAAELLNEPFVSPSVKQAWVPRYVPPQQVPLFPVRSSEHAPPPWPPPG